MTLGTRYIFWRSYATFKSVASRLLSLIAQTICHVFAGQRGYLVTPHGFLALQRWAYAMRAIVQ